MRQVRNSPPSVVSVADTYASVLMMGVDNDETKSRTVAMRSQKREAKRKIRARSVAMTVLQLVDERGRKRQDRERHRAREHALFASPNLDP